jgi:hypothetical protein
MIMAEITFEIVDHLLVLSVSPRGWTKEVNIVSWNGRVPKIDIREWDEAHEKMGKGVTLSRDELLKIKEWLDQADLEALDLG